MTKVNDELLLLKQAMQDERIKDPEDYAGRLIAGTVSEWNMLREKMKARFSREAISMMDASGFITEWLKNKAL